MDVWVVSNPGPNAVGCPHPRPDQSKGQIDLQLEGFEFAIFTEDEMDVWRLSVDFKQLVDTGYILTSQTSLDSLPSRKKDIPDNLKPEAYDHQVAYQIALAPDETDDIQLARINLFRDVDGTRGWADEADTAYLKGRHLPLLKASKWYLEDVTKRTSSQDKRLRDIKRQIKAIEGLL